MQTPVYRTAVGRILRTRDAISDIIGARPYLRLSKPIELSVYLTLVHVAQLRFCVQPERLAMYR